MKNKKFIKVGMILLCMMFVLCSCAPKAVSAPGQDQAAQGTSTAATPDTFIYGIDGDPGNAINVITTNDRFGLMSVKLLFSPLYMYNGADKIEYFLAESMTPSEDFLSYTAKLRQDVKWHDGKPFTADDVVFTYEQMLKESNAGWAYGQLIFGGKPVKVEKVDDYTVKFTLPTVSMSAMEALGNIFIMPKHIFEGEENIANSPKNATPVGTGPYKFKEYKPGEYLKCEKNADYYLGAPKINNVIFRIIGDANTAQMALQNGEINALAISPTDVEKFNANEGIKIIPYSENRVGYMAFNMASKKVQSKDLRKAVVYALNRPEMNKATYISEEFSYPAYSFLPRMANYFSENVEKYDYNIEKAKEYLAKANSNGVKLKLGFIANNKVYEKQAVMMQQSLKAIGVELELVGVDGTALYNKLGEGTEDYDMFLGGYIMGIDPDIYNPIFVTGDPGNYSRYSNKNVDKLFAEGRIEQDNEKRKAIYEQIQQIIADDAVFYPISENKRILAIDARIQGTEEAGLVPVYTFEDMSKLYFK